MIGLKCKRVHPVENCESSLVKFPRLLLFFCKLDVVCSILQFSNYETFARPLKLSSASEYTQYKKHFYRVFSGIPKWDMPAI